MTLECSYVLGEQEIKTEDGPASTNGTFNMDGMCYLCSSIVKLLFKEPNIHEALSMRFICRFLHRHVKSYSTPELVLNQVHKRK